MTFLFYGTGNIFIKDGKTYHIKNGLQSIHAHKSNLSYMGKPIKFKLYDELGNSIDE